MPQFRYYIVDTEDGFVKGTNDEIVAKHFAENPDFYVVNSIEGKWMNLAEEAIDISEVGVPIDE